MNTDIDGEQCQSNRRDGNRALCGDGTKLYRVLWVLLVALYLMRIIYLDADLPNWNILTYQPIDEGFYGNLALNVQNFGTIDPNSRFAGKFEFLMQPNEITPLLMNIPIWLFMQLLGDNYFGFRMASVAEGLLLLFLTTHLVKCLAKDLEISTAWRERLPLLAGLLVTISFPVFVATRVIEPSITRAVCVAVIVKLYSGIRYENLRIRSFAIGLTVVASVLLVYATNTFLGLIVVFFCIFFAKREGPEFVKTHIQYGVLGAIVSYCVALIYFEKVWNISPLASFWLNFAAFAGSSNPGYSGTYTPVASLWQVGKNARDFVAANLVLYSLPLLPAVMLGFLVPSKSGNRWREALLSSKVAILALFLQTLVTSDFIVRKIVVVIAPLCVVCFAGLWRIWHWREQSASRLEKVVLIVCIMVEVYVYIFRMFYVHNALVSYEGFDHTNQCLVAILAASGIALGLALLAFPFGTAPNEKLVHAELPAVLSIAVSLCFACNIALVYHNCFEFPTFSEKQAMIDIGKIVGRNIVAGDYAEGFTLYNDIQPLSNDRSIEVEYVNKYDIYFFDYAGANSFTSDPRDIWQSVRVVRIFERDYVGNGGNSEVALYRRNYTGDETE